jgi:hypothetical protein
VSLSCLLLFLLLSVVLVCHLLVDLVLSIRTGAVGKVFVVNRSFVGGTGQNLALAAQLTLPTLTVSSTEFVVGCVVVSRALAVGAALTVHRLTLTRGPAFTASVMADWARFIARSVDHTIRRAVVRHGDVIGNV